MKRAGSAKRFFLVLVSLAAVTGAVLLLASGASGRTGNLSPTTPVTTKIAPGGQLVPSQSGAPTSTLPPSRDNDAGHSRIIDQYPDADLDWYQWH